MIEITTGTIEEQIIKFLQETYPATVSDIESKLRLSEKSKNDKENLSNIILKEKYRNQKSMMV